MKTSRVLAAAVLLVAVAALFGGVLNRAHVAEATASHHYTLRVGDKVSIPGLGQICVLEEPSRLNLICEKKAHAHHQVQIFRSEMLVYKFGGGTAVRVWEGKP
jgi:hypothetical protein